MVLRRPKVVVALVGSRMFVSKTTGSHVMLTKNEMPKPMSLIKEPVSILKMRVKLLNKKLSRLQYDKEIRAYHVLEFDVSNTEYDSICWRGRWEHVGQIDGNRLWQQQEVIAHILVTSLK